MKYQDCAAAAQAANTPCEGADMAAPRLSDTNINPATGLATDYLNHFNEAIMLLELLATCPDCREDFLGWRPMSYREHFAASRFNGRDLAIAAYDAADPAMRGRLDTLAAAMTAMLEATRARLSADLPPAAAGMLANRAAAWLRLLVARAGAVINGDAEEGAQQMPQTVVDRLMKR